MNKPRFRIEITDHGDCWEAAVYDHEDHGPELMYAGVTAGSLAQVLDQAAHYVLVAAPERVPVSGEDGDAT